MTSSLLRNNDDVIMHSCVCECVLYNAYCAQNELSIHNHCFSPAWHILWYV